MEKLKKKKGIKKQELLYHLYGGLREVIKIMKRYPEQPAFKEATFTFAVEQEKSKTGKIQIFVGFESSGKKKYSKTETVTIIVDEKAPAYQPKNFDWKEAGLNLRLEFAGYLLRRLSASVIADRETPGLKNKNITIKDDFSVTKTNAGLLGFNFYDGLGKAEGKISSSKTVTHSMTIIFEIPEPKPGDAIA